MKSFCCRNLPLWERWYCYFLIVIGLLGGACSLYIAFQDIFSTKFQIPCYLQTDNQTQVVKLGSH